MSEQARVRIAVCGWLLAGVCLRITAPIMLDVAQAPAAEPPLAMEIPALAAAPEPAVEAEAGSVESVREPDGERTNPVEAERPVPAAEASSPIAEAPASDAKPPVRAAAPTTRPARPKVLKRTDLVATLDAPMIAGRNVIWTAAFDLAWKELADVHGGPLAITPPSFMAMTLNDSPVTKADVPEGGLVAIGGAGTAATVERIRGQLKEAFGDDFDSRLVDGLADLPEQSAIGYAAIKRHLPFQTKFDDMEGVFAFPSGDDSRRAERIRVKMFGVDDMWSVGENPPKRQVAQVRVIWHEARPLGLNEYGMKRHAQQFVVELLTSVKTDRLILASVGPGRTLASTVDEVLHRLAMPNTFEPKSAADLERIYGKDVSPGTRLTPEMSTCAGLLSFEGLEVPVVDMDLMSDYMKALSGKIISQGELRGYDVTSARQAVRFRMDRTGATLKAEGEASGVWGEPVVRRFEFTQPFLILLMKKDAKRPYFAAWIGNDELLVPAKADSDDE